MTVHPRKVALAAMLPLLGSCALVSSGRGGLGDPARVNAIEKVNVRVDTVVHRGSSAIRVTEDSVLVAGRDVTTMAILGGGELTQGTIELEIAGELPPNASPTARGFVGIAFRVQGAGERYQVLYLRPTNGRSLDQARRNHTTQYQAMPGYPWSRLRAEEPSVYESYVDMVPGAWTRMRIELARETARLYVHDAPEPALIVNDLKTPDRTGRVALWIGPESVGYFRELRIRGADGQSPVAARRIGSKF